MRGKLCFVPTMEPKITDDFSCFTTSLISLLRSPQSWDWEKRARHNSRASQRSIDALIFSSALILFAISFLFCRLKHFSFFFFALFAITPSSLRCSSLIVKTWWPFRLSFCVSSIHSTTSEHQQSAMTEKKKSGGWSCEWWEFWALNWWWRRRNLFFGLKPF